MQLVSRLGLMLGLMLASALSVAAQTGALGFPALGFVYDSRSNRIRPIRGIPGAAVLGEAVDTGSAFASAVISPQQNQALAVSPEDDRLNLVALADGSVRAIPGAMPAPAHIVFSPSGLAAVIWRSRIQILTGLAQSPHATDLDAGLMGAPKVIAISDDARQLLASSSQEEADPVWSLNPDGSATQLPLPGSTAVIAFRRNSHDAVVVTRPGDVYLVRNAGPAAEIRQVYAGDEQTSDPVAVQVSLDGAHAYAVNRRGTVAVINLESGSAAAISCGCSPAGLEPLNSTALFRLTGISDGPVMLFDASTSTPQIWFVPGDSSTANVTRSAQ
jgi:hypothetical protein